MTHLYRSAIVYVCVSIFYGDQLLAHNKIMWCMSGRKNVQPDWNEEKKKLCGVKVCACCVYLGINVCQSILE